MRVKPQSRPRSRQLPQKKTSLQKVILFIDNKVTPLFFPPILFWDMRIMCCMLIPCMYVCEPHVTPRITAILEYALLLNDYYLGTGPDSGDDLQIGVMAEIMAAVILVSMLIVLAALMTLILLTLNGLATNFVWWTKLVLYWELLEYTGIEDCLYIYIYM